MPNLLEASRRALVPAPPAAPRRGRRAAPSDRTVTVVAVVCAAALTALYATLSIRRHAQMLTTGYDLGIFEQAVRSYAEGHLPVAPLKGPGYPLLGDHFSPALAVLAPIYRLFPSPVTLLVAQAVLLAVAVIPLVRWAGRRLGLPAALVVAVGYGLSWGIASTVVFDFHEVVLAVPLVAFSATAWGNGRLRAAVLWALPLVLVKEDLGLTVAALGVLVAWRGRRTWGLVALAAGVIATVVETWVLIPAANLGGADTYTGQLTPAVALEALVSLPGNSIKMTTLVLLLLPTAFVAVRSPLLLVTVPTLAWRMLSDNPFYWGTGFHYSAILMPVVLAAFVDGLIRIGAGSERARHGATILRPRPWALVASVAVTGALLVHSPWTQLFEPSLWQESAHVATAHRLLDQIPDGASVVASNTIAPQLTSRATVSMATLAPLEQSRPDYLLVDTSIAQQWPVGGDALRQLTVQALGSGYRLVADEDGLVLLARG